jgi:hypothetical protein
MMKYLLLLTILLMGCSKLTSMDIQNQAVKECTNTPELDGQRMYCIYFSVKKRCELELLDLKICGTLEQR